MSQCLTWGLSFGPALAIVVALTIPFTTRALAQHSSGTANDAVNAPTAITSIALTADTPGSTTTGITSVDLTATITPSISGVTVNFNDTSTLATYQAVTNSSGQATSKITTGTAGVAGGLNVFTAGVTGTTNYSTAGPSSPINVYFQGILFSTAGLHDFSGVITNYPGYPSVEGTVDGTQLGPYGVSIYNFTPNSVTLPLSFTSAASGAFSYSNSCQAAIPSKGACSISFFYAPPFGDGCVPGGTPTCTSDGAGYPQGTYESAPWSLSFPANTLSGIGDQGFDRSGSASPSGTLAGKAILAPGALNISPLTLPFGTVAVNSTTTSTVTLTNSNNTSLAYTYAAPISGKFTLTDNCTSPLASNASCQIFVAPVTTNAGGPFKDSFSITPAGGTAETVSLSATVAAAGTGVTLSTASHNFGNVTVGSTVTFALNITNATNKSVTLALSNSTGAGITTSTGCGTSLAAGGQCTYVFSFAPSATGASTDSLTVTSSVPVIPGTGGDSSTVTVTGTGVAAANLTASTVQHNWNSIAVGTQGGLYGVQLSNNTGAAVTLSVGPITAAGKIAGFTAQTTCLASLANNSSCEIDFNFTPSVTGITTVVYPVSPSVTWNNATYSGITLIGTGLPTTSASTMPFYPGAVFYGDSNTDAFGSSTYTSDPTCVQYSPANTCAWNTNSVPWLMADAVGGTVLNYARTGAMMADQVNLAFGDPVLSADQHPSIVALGLNEAHFWGSNTNLELNFQAETNAMVVVRSVPTSTLVTAQGGLVTFTGSWSPDTNILGGSIASYTSAAVATASFPITTTMARGPIYIGWVASSYYGGGVFNVTVDGSPCSTPTITSSGYGGTAVTTNFNLNTVLFVQRCTGIAAGNHTVLFVKTATTNYGELAFVAAPPTYASSPVSGPPVTHLEAVIHEYLDGDSAATTAYSAFLYSAATAFTADGLYVDYIDTRTHYINYNSSTDMNCGSSNLALHLCNAGLLQWRDAIEAQIPLHN
jgi:hypothetical protein